MTAEIIDGEVMVVDFHEGHYYNLLGSSALAWALIAAGYDAASISAVLEERYGRSDLLEGVEGFVARLEAENLIRPSSAMHTGDVDLAAFSNAFTGLSVEKFSDMQELLLLDPIHDVDASGWPRAKA